MKQNPDSVKRLGIQKKMLEIFGNPVIYRTKQTIIIKSD